MEELAALAFELDVALEGLPAVGKVGQARELVLLMARTGRLPELADAVHRRRPHFTRQELATAVSFDTLAEAVALLFGEEELKTLVSLALGVDYENLPAVGKLAKVERLVCQLKQNGRLPELVALCQEKRPFVPNWETLAVPCPRFTLPQRIGMATLALLLLLAVGYWLIWPLPLADGYNVVVAKFGMVDENGRVRATELSETISETLAAAMAQKTEQLSSTLSNIHFRGPSDVGFVAGTTAEERAVAAEVLAKRHNATILIYGVVTEQGDMFAVEMAFSVTETGFGYGREVIGAERLGSPIPLARSLSPADHEALKRALQARTEALQKVVEGLANYYFAFFDAAYADFKQAAGNDAAWPDDKGKEVIHLLLGATRLQIYSGAEAPNANDLLQAAADFAEAKRLDPTYARSYLGLGTVALASLEMITETAVLVPELTRIESLYAMALQLPDQPAAAHIPIRASNGLGDLYLQAQQRQVASWPGQQTADLLQCPLANPDNYVVEVGKCAFQAALAAYEAAERPLNLNPLVAHIHAKLGVLAGYEGDWQKMVVESQTAIDLVEALPASVVVANQKWIAHYWAQTGLAYLQQNEVDDAQFAYCEAIRLGLGHVEDEDIERWKAAKPKPAAC